MVRNLEELGTTLQKIVTRLEANQDLMKLLYYTDSDPLSHADLSSTVIQNEIYQKLLKVTPYVGSFETANSKIAIRINSGLSNANIEFVNIHFSIDVFVPSDQWFIEETNFRPFCIMGRILETLRGKTLNGLGKIQGGDFSLTGLTEEMTCYTVDFVITQYD